jgi:hypothetical protein
MNLSQGIQGEDFDVPILASESGKTPGYVKDKIKRTKKKRSLARARKEARKEQWPPCLAKVIKKAISISELLTERDQAASLRVLREAKAATHRIYDPTSRQLIEVPDHKTRLAAVTLELAYAEGRPVERQISVSGDVEDFAAMLEKARQSPAALEALQTTTPSQKTSPSPH